MTEQLRKDIDAALDRYSRDIEGCPAHLTEALRYSLLAPGKRVRPVLALLACELCGGETVTALPVACAVEMIHAYSLIHDDLPSMDDDDLRRGRPTCHVKFGEATAILAGDALQALAFHVIARHIDDKAVACRCVEALADAAGSGGMVGGQADDTLTETEKTSHQDASPQDRLLAIHRRKTGALLRVSLVLGGLVGGADGERLQALAEYGEHFGLAFQITDDLLDRTGDEATVGKRLNKDADKHKLTYPDVFGFDKARADAEREVRAACEALAPFKPDERTSDDQVRLAYETLLSLSRNLLDRKH